MHKPPRLPPQQCTEGAVKPHIHLVQWHRIYPHNIEWVTGRELLSPKYSEHAWAVREEWIISNQVLRWERGRICNVWVLRRSAYCNKNDDWNSKNPPYPSMISCLPAPDNKTNGIILTLNTDDVHHSWSTHTTAFQLQTVSSICIKYFCKNSNINDIHAIQILLEGSLENIYISYIAVILYNVLATVHILFGETYRFMFD